MNVNVKRVQAFNATHTTAQTMRLILTRGSYRRSTLVGLGLLFFQQFAGTYSTCGPRRDLLAD
jgi:hypothetical protein